jgi:quinone-modifying oxidoreductase subunit QmoC
MRMRKLRWLRELFDVSLPAKRTKSREKKDRRRIVQDWEARGRIHYEADLDRSIGREIVSLPGGDALLSCIQCGTCSATCPVSTYMDYTPRKIIAMTRAGFKHDVLRCLTIWLCASCYSCTVECPRQIKITDLMYSLKQKAIKEKVYPPRFPIPVLAREFYKLIRQRGRSSESRLITRMYLKTNPLAMFGQIGLGLRLLWKGRLDIDLPLPAFRPKPGKELGALLAALDANGHHHGGKSRESGVGAVPSLDSDGQSRGGRDSASATPAKTSSKSPAPAA